MTFFCPACKSVKPMEDGLLVMEHAPHSPHIANAGRIGNQNPPVVAILCGPCTGDILIDRAKVRATRRTKVR